MYISLPPSLVKLKISHIFQFHHSWHLSIYHCRAKFVPDFLPTEEVAPALSTLPTLSSNDGGGNVKSDEKFSPPTPEEAERIISNLLPR